MTSEFTELVCASPSIRDKAASQTGAATIGLQSLLIRETHLHEALQTLKANGIQTKTKKSDISDEDMWPTWPNDPE